ncbi:MAG: phospholipase domain protein [Bacillota bacterium]
MYYNPLLYVSWDAGPIATELQTNTHLFLIYKAIDLLRLSSPSPLVQQALTVIQKNWDQLAAGSRDADEKMQYKQLGTYTGHFYNPETGRSYIPFVDTAKDYFFYLLNLATTYWNNCDFTQATYYLGLALHFLADIGIPLHAVNFTAISLPIGFHPAIETFVKQLHSRLAPDVNSFIKPPLNTNIQDEVLNLAWSSHDLGPQILTPASKQAYSNNQPETWHSIVAVPLQLAMSNAVYSIARILTLWFTQNPVPLTCQV